MPIILGGDRPETEIPTMTCNHCNAVVILNRWRIRERHACYRCRRYVCDRCHALGECNPIDQGIELALAHPTAGPFLARAPDGRVLFDTRLRDRRRIF